MSQFISKYVVCPFYRRHDNNRICCEGTSRDNTINLVFSDQKKLKQYTVAKCESMSGCKSCRIYEMLDRKYPPSGGV
jgi:hypothetical protein